MFSWTHCKPSTWGGKVFTSCIHCLSRQTLSPNKFDYNKEKLHRGTSRKVSCKSNQEHGVFLPSGCDLIWEQTNPDLSPMEPLVLLVIRVLLVNFLAKALSAFAQLLPLDEYFKPQHTSTSTSGTDSADIYICLCAIFDLLLTYFNMLI